MASGPSTERAEIKVGASQQRAYEHLTESVFKQVGIVGADPWARGIAQVPRRPPAVML
jgi:hypothetical protein